LPFTWTWLLGRGLRRAGVPEKKFSRPESARVKSQPMCAQRRPLLLIEHKFRIHDDLGFGDHLRFGMQGQDGTQWGRSEELHLETSSDKWNGCPGLCFPAALISLPHDNGGRVTIEDRRNNPTVEEAEPVVVLGTRCECCHCAVTFAITAKMESIWIGVATPEAGEVGK